jgi:Cd2+/Zn2+-exporting ATPase
MSENAAVSSAAGKHGFRLFSARGELWSSIAAGGLLLVGVVVWLVMGRSAEGVLALNVCAWMSLAIGMLHASRAAWESVQAWRFEIDVLMVLGAVLAAVVGHPGEGALLLFLFVLAGALEELASQRTQRAVEALHKLMPTKALRLEEQSGEWRAVSPQELVPGDIVKVLPGESIPADGRVSLGRTSVDQANLTGESVPRSVDVGDEVFAGTINAGDPLQVRVTRRANESSLQRVLDLVLRAQQQREPVQRVIDKVNQPYAVGVFVASLAVFVVWKWVLGESLDRSMFTAITLLIVASPCAVIIATPTATLAAIARGARAGVLFKGGQSIERLAQLSAIAFDKTGTLTVGKMRVQALHPIGWSDERALLAVAAGLEQDSTHPIAAAVRARAVAERVEASNGIKPRAFPGRGVEAQIDGKAARLGTLVHTEELIPVCLRANVREVLKGVQQRGKIGTVVVHDQQAGVIILSDTVRPGADRLVQDLHAMGVKPVVMLTGDNRATAAAVAESLGLDRFEAELLPEDKLKAVAGMRDQLRGSGSAGGVGVIGDGVNDAPALAAADVSIAIGSIGSDAALESAEIVLLSDDLGIIPWAVGLARRTRRTVMFNLSFALGAIALMSVATLVGARLGVPLPLWMGVLGHEGGTLLVVGNSLLLLGIASPRRSPAREEIELQEPTVTPAMASVPAHAAAQ